MDSHGITSFQGWGTAVYHASPRTPGAGAAAFRECRAVPGGAVGNTSGRDENSRNTRSEQAYSEPLDPFSIHSTQRASSLMTRPTLAMVPFRAAIAAALLASVSAVALAIEDRADMEPSEPVGSGRTVAWKLTPSLYRETAGGRMRLRRRPYFRSEMTGLERDSESRISCCARKPGHALAGPWTCSTGPVGAGPTRNCFVQPASPLRTTGNPGLPGSPGTPKSITPTAI